MQRVKKPVLWTLLAFFVYAIVTSPGQAADVIHSTWDIIVEGVRSMGNFFDALLNRN